MFRRNAIFHGVLTAALLAVTPSANAQEWSFGASIGSTEIDGFCELFGPGVSCDDTDTGTKFYLGRDVHPNFRVEGFWVDLGEAEATDSVGDSATAEADGFGVNGMAIAPLSEDFEVFGKVGLFMWDADVRVTISGVTSTGSDDGTDPFIGFGGRFHVSQEFAVRAEWEEYDLDGDDVTMISIGGEIRF